LIFILAGGRSSRMGKEKPVLKIAGKEMLLWVYDEISSIDETVVALSKNTPKTKNLCLRERITFVETPGRGYVEDIKWLLTEFGAFVSVSADLPFVKACDVALIRNELEKKKVSITGVLPINVVPKDLRITTYRGYAIVGINGVSYGGEEFVELSNPLLALNVNTPMELELANRIAKLLQPKFTKDVVDIKVFPHYI